MAIDSLSFIINEYNKWKILLNSDVKDNRIDWSHIITEWKSLWIF